MGTPPLRARAAHAALALATIGVGLAVHLGGHALPPRLRDALGDALWAAMLVWWVSALWPARPLRWRAGLALGGAFAVEASQLLRTPALDAVRATRFGHLVLGSDFDARDLPAYAAGVLAAAAAEWAWRRATGR